MEAGPAAHADLGAPPLLLEIAFFRDQADGRCGIVRLTVDEARPGRPRFRLRDGDVVVKDLLPDEVTVEAQSDEAGGGQATLLRAAAPGDCSLLLRHSPFEAQVSAGGRVLQRLNARRLLNFEQHRDKCSAPRGGLIDATDADSSNLWEEPFGEFLDTKPRGPAAVGLDVTFPRAPVLVGLAEHATRLDLAAPGFAEPYRLYNLDVFEYEIDVPTALYGGVPMVTAVHMWPEDGGGAAACTASGLLAANPSEGFVKVDGPAGGASAPEGGDTLTWWLFESGILDLFSFAGPSPEAVLRQYHSVTGRPRLPPLAALGKHQSRWNYVDVEDVLSVDKGFDKHRIPYDFLWLDLEHTDGKRYFTWDPAHFADAGLMLDTLAKSGRKVVTIIDPHLKGDDNYTVFARMRDADLLTRSANASQYEGFCWPGPSYYPDFCNPAARELWASFFDPAVYPHSRHDLYTWNDMNEPSVFDGPEISMPRDNLHSCHAGAYDVEHRDIHNVYGFYHHWASVEGQLRRAPGVRPFVLTRSFFAGSHRLGPVWTGDNMVSWDHLARSVPMLVSLALCGLSLAGADVPGFMGDPDAQLFVRWHQLGIWYPFYRGHAHLTTKRREPWQFGPEVTALVREAVVARYQLLPMWYTLIADWVFQGLPVMRPLWYHDLGDAAAHKHADDHFFLGEAVLVRAITKPDAKKLNTYLPKGEWFDFWNAAAGAFVGGALSLKLHRAHLPVFVRSGHILCKKMRPRRSAEAMSADPYTVEVYGAPATGRVYVDDGRSHDFEGGAFIYDLLTFDGASLRAETYESPLLGGIRAAARLAPGVPPAGLRIERVALFGLQRRPTGARLRGADGTRELQLLVTAVESGGSWSATVKDPAVRLGDHDWAVELSF